MFLRKRRFSWLGSRTVILGLILLAGGPGGAEAAVRLSYGGRLTESNGAPTTGPVNVEVRFFNVASGGTSLVAAIPLNGVSLNQGYFQISFSIDDSEINTVFPSATADVWIEIKDVTHGRTFPRQRFSVTPQALKVPVGSSMPYNASGQLDVTPNQLVPVGTVIMSASSAAPGGWLVCDGRTVSRTTYASLFASIGTTFGAGDGTTTFHLPDLRNRFVVGTGTTYAVGNTGGASSINLTQAQPPAHAHTASASSAGAHSHTVSTTSAGGHTHPLPLKFLNNATHAHWGMGGQVSEAAGGAGDGTAATISSAGAHTHPTTVSTDGSHAHTITVENTGSGSAIDVRPPYLGLSFLIKY